MKMIFALAAAIISSQGIEISQSPIDPNCHGDNYMNCMTQIKINITSNLAQ